MRRRGLLAALLLAVAVALPGCAQVPDSGPPVAVPNRTLEGADIRVNFPIVAPPAFGGPQDTVDLFIEAARSTQSRELLSSTFLTPTGRETWERNFGEVQVYRSGRTALVNATEDRAVVKIAGTMVGTVNDQGVYQVRRPSAPFELSITLVHTNVWLIETPPPGVLLQESDFAQAFEQTTLYFPATDSGGTSPGGSGEVLVPERRFVGRTSSRESLATSVVRNLLRGPSSWLAGVAHNPLPQKTDLRGNVTTSGSDLVIGMSPEIEGAPAADVNLFVAQIAWSMPTRPEERLRLQVNGRDIDVDGAPAVQDLGNWRRYNPHSGSSSSLYYLQKGALKKLLDRNPSARVPEDPPGREAAAAGIVSAAVSLDESQLALVKAGPGKQTLWLGDLAGNGHSIRTATTISRPTWGGSREAVLVAIDGQLHQVETTGAVVPVTVPPGLPPIRSVRSSLDGTRVAIIAGDAPTAAAYIALIDRRQAGAPPVLRDLRPVQAPEPRDESTPIIARVQDIGWAGPTEVAVAGQEADDAPRVRIVSIDGALELSPTRTGLRPGVLSLAVSALAGAPQTEYVESNKQLFQGGQRTWSALTSLVEIQAPFYPG